MNSADTTIMVVIMLQLVALAAAYFMYMWSAMHRDDSSDKNDSSVNGAEESDQEALS